MECSGCPRYSLVPLAGIQQGKGAVCRPYLSNVVLEFPWDRILASSTFSFTPRLSRSYCNRSLGKESSLFIIIVVIVRYCPPPLMPSKPLFYSQCGQLTHHFLLCLLPTPNRGCHGLETLRSCFPSFQPLLFHPSPSQSHVISHDIQISLSGT